MWLQRQLAIDRFTERMQFREEYSKNIMFGWDINECIKIINRDGKWENMWEYKGACDV